MGTSYYLHQRANIGGPCSKCGRSDPPFEPLHIGRSSAGWAFALHVFKADQTDLPRSLEDWLGLFIDQAYYIEDEYGAAVSTSEMLHCIFARTASARQCAELGFLRNNDCWRANSSGLLFPNRVSRQYIGQTFYLARGEFS